MFRKILLQTRWCHRYQGSLLTTQYSVGKVTHSKQIHYQVCLEYPRHTSKTKINNTTSPAISSKYEVITEDNSQIMENSTETYGEDKYPLLTDEYDGINLQRGKEGVFDIEDLVELLQRENAKDIFVVTVPKEINYVSQMCIVSGRSKRHIRALAEYVRKVFKKKCQKTDSIPKIEGKDSDTWMALDLGNIALHIFSSKTRQIYDLETLWACGAEYDEQINKKSKVIEIFENYSQYLKDLKPLA